MGFARTRSAARQFVSHRHVTVNDHVVNIPSYSLKPGDKVSIRERSKSLEAIADAVTSSNNSFSWLDVDRKELSGTFLNLPERSEIPENIKEQLIVELYSK
jgi:small subunit ribosomal protein S4